MKDEMDKILQPIRELLIAHLGALPPELDRDRVPTEIRPLLDEARFLGIGDDGLREAVGKVLPPTYLSDLVARVAEKNAPFQEWANQEQREERHAYEWVVFACLFELVGYVQAIRSAPTPAARTPLTETECAELIAKINAIDVDHLGGRR